MKITTLSFFDGCDTRTYRVSKWNHGEDVVRKGFWFTHRTYTSYSDLGFRLCGGTR